VTEIHDSTRTRLFVDTDLAAGMSVGVSPSQAHYLSQVLRLKAGAKVALFNGRDGEWIARIDGAGRGWCSLSVDIQSRRQVTEPDLWLAFAPIKRARIDFIAQKATELGVSRMVPMMTRYTQVARVNTERLLANAIEAAEQCGRLTVPTVSEPTALADLLAGWPPDRRILLCDERGDAPSALDALSGAAAAPWAILIGPEGGFHPDERETLRSLPQSTPISLGPRILRADTAVVSAISVWQALAGDWR